MIKHIPVFSKKIINNLFLKERINIIVDSTFGNCGHLSFILKKTKSKDIVIAIDKDKNNFINKNAVLLKIKNKFKLNIFCAKFSDLNYIFKIKKIKKFDYFFSDLGKTIGQTIVSSDNFIFVKIIQFFLINFLKN